MEKISIIVPVYNAEKYLEKTLRALCGQTYRNLEIILINDGSQDGSWQICEKFAGLDERISCYDIPNGGPSNARNEGISKATGTYIGFCDSDDLPDKTMYQTLVEYLEKAEADIALCDIYTERDGRNFGFPWDDNTIFEKDEIISRLMARMIGNLSDNEKDTPVWGSVVRCLFKREVIGKGGVQFPNDIHFAEDLVFVLRYLSLIQKAVICDKPLYFYTCNERSIMNSFSFYKKNMFPERRRLVEYIEKIIERSGDTTLRKRLTVTERCYYHECVGNACRKATGRTKKCIKEEIRMIVNDVAVRKAFKKYDAKDIKTKIKYWIIKHKLVGLVYLYYSLRFK